MGELIALIETMLPVIKSLAWLYIAFKITVAIITVTFTIWIFAFILKRLRR